MLFLVVTVDENTSLCRSPSIDEVQNALQSIPMDSSPNPDGFSTSFFTLAWDIVKDDLVEMANDFFLGSTFFYFLQCY